MGHNGDMNLDFIVESCMTFMRLSTLVLRILHQQVNTNLVLYCCPTGLIIYFLLNLLKLFIFELREGGRVNWVIEDKGVCGGGVWGHAN